MKKVFGFFLKHWLMSLFVITLFFCVGIFLSFGGGQKKENQKVSVSRGSTNSVVLLETLEASLSHGRVVIVCGTNVVDHPFITSHDAFGWVVEKAKTLPIGEPIRLVAKGENLDVDETFESIGDLIAFVAKWRDKLSPIKVIMPTVVTNKATISGESDTAYVEAQIRRMRAERQKEITSVVADAPVSTGFPPVSKPSGRRIHEERVLKAQPLTQPNQEFSSLQPPAFNRPSEKKTGIGRWWQRVSCGPDYTVVTYTPRSVRWRYRQTYPYSYYAYGGLFQPTPVMIGQSW